MTKRFIGCPVKNSHTPSKYCKLSYLLRFSKMGLGHASKGQSGQYARFQMGNTMRVGRRPTKFGALLMTDKCVEDELLPQQSVW